MAQDEKMIQKVMIQKEDGTFEGPYPISALSKYILHEGIPLADILGVGLDPYNEGSIIEQLEYIRNTKVPNAVQIVISQNKPSKGPTLWLKPLNT